MQDRGPGASCRPARASSTMASINGAVTPPEQAEHRHSQPPADSAEKKRKREEDVAHDGAHTDSVQGQRDISDILRQYVVWLVIWNWR